MEALAHVAPTDGSLTGAFAFFATDPQARRNFD